MRSRRNSKETFKALVWIAILVFKCGSACAVTLPFEDGLENIDVGVHPGQNGWQTMFSGKSAYVSDAIAHTGTKSFRLDSHPNWARFEYVLLEEIPDRLTYEVAICLDPTEGKGAYVGFAQKVSCGGGYLNCGATWNRFTVGGQSGVRFSGAPGVDVYCGPYTPGTWCTVRADLDFVNLTADVWCNGELIAEDVGIRPKEWESPQYPYHMVSNRWTVVSTNYSPATGSSNVVYFDDVSIYETPELPDFSISDVKPAQVVLDCDIDEPKDGKIDLVAGKSTVVLVYVVMENHEELDKEELVGVRLSFQGVDYTKSKTIMELEENNRIEFDPIAPTTTGDQTIIAEVDPQNDFEEADETNNAESVEITVKETNSLYLVYFPVDRPITYFWYGPINMTDYENTVTNSGKFIQATYPVAEGKFTNEPKDNKYYGSPVPFLGLIDDLIGLKIWAELLTGASADRAVGIVPNNYFDYHFPGAKGVAFPGVPAGLVEVDLWTVAAHEIGHTFGLYLKWPWGPGEEYEINSPNGNRAEGFWVNKEVTPEDPERDISNGWCFMGNRYRKKEFVFWDENPFWIENRDYVDLFQKFRVDQTDPPDVLLINGIISNDGTIQLGSLYMLENGTIDDVMPGDYSIQLCGADGQTLTNIPFHTAFYAHVDPIGIVETDFAGFAFVISYPENVSTIQIQHNGQTLIEINPNSRLLHDAVDSIPDYGFVKNPDQRRKALHNKIDEFETKIENEEIRDARNKLELDIRDKFEKWLVDGYQKENPGQLSKEEVLDLVDNILERFDIMWSGSSTSGEIAEPEFHSPVTEEAVTDLDEAIDLAFYEWIEAEEAAASMPPPDSPSTDADDNSTVPEEDVAGPDEDAEVTDEDPADTGEDEWIVVDEAAFTLFEAVETINELDPENFSNEELAIALTNQIDVALSMMDEGLLTEALDVLENDILERTNGCANIGEPDENDWITTYEGQGEVYPLIVEAIELLESLMQ